METDHIGFNGPMVISKMEDSFSPEEKKWLDIWKKAGEEIGFKPFDNSNMPQVEGFGPFHMTKREGRRFSAYEGFLKPILHRHTLTIHRYSEVKKVN